MVQSLWPILFTYPYSYGPLSIYKSVSHPISGMITSFEAVKVTAISGRSFTVFGGIGEYMFCGQLPTYEKRIEEVDIDRGNLPTIVF